MSDVIEVVAGAPPVIEVVTGVPGPAGPPGPVAGYALVETLGGDPHGYTAPAVADVYPAGVTVDKLIPGSWPIVLNATALLAGDHVLECSARVEAAGARAKVALYDLDADVRLVEVTFPADETIGARGRSATFTIPATDTTLGVKITTNNPSIGAAAWGCRLLRTP